MGISKTPIRKALGRLHMEGFLDNTPYRGYSVVEISAETIAEVYELRELLESHLVRATTVHFVPAELDQMEALIDEADAALSAGDYVKYVDYNREFHRAFARKGNNRRVETVLSNLEEHVRRIIMYVLQNGFHDLLDLQRPDHREILEAVRCKDIARAAERTQAHLRGFSKALIARQTAHEVKHAVG